MGGIFPQEAAFSKLLTAQVAREFSAARRYLLAASVVKEMSDHFHVAEEEQRIKAMQVMEYARIHGIALTDYQSQIQATPIDSAMSPVEFLRELMFQEQHDMQLLDKSLSSLYNNPDLVSFLQSISTEQLDRQQEMVQLLAQVSTATTVPATADMLVASTTTGLENINPIHLPKSAAAGGGGQDLGVVNNPHVVPQVQTALRHLVDRLMALPHPGMAAAGAVGAAAVDSDALPSTEDILDALPIDTEAFMEVVDSLPTTDDILEALPIDTDVLLEVVDNAATFLEEQSELVGDLQQNLMDADTVSQIVDIVTQLYVY